MNARDTATVTAALRQYQALLTTGTPLHEGIAEIATDGGWPLPTAEDIDDLCERIGVAPTVVVGIDGGNWQYSYADCPVRLIVRDHDNDSWADETPPVNPGAVAADIAEGGL